ncbi:MAG: phage baseplate plug protein [Bradymonadaceae bacterium]
MEQLRAFPNLPNHTMTVRLGGITFRYRRTYRPRLRAWYVDIFNQDGNPVLIGRRINPEWSLQGSLPVEEIPGIIFVRGPEGYTREELGRDLVEIFIPTDELPVIDTEDDGVQVVLS